MVENENYKSYTANNGTELRFPKESVVQMTTEQRKSAYGLCAGFQIIAVRKKCAGRAELLCVHYEIWYSPDVRREWLGSFNLYGEKDGRTQEEPC